MKNDTKIIPVVTYSNAYVNKSNILKEIEVKAVYIDELINSTMTVILEVQLT